MNKETRNFIWGLILLFTCGTAVAINIVEMINGQFNWMPDLLILFPLQIFGVAIGSTYIFKNVD